MSFTSLCSRAVPLRAFIVLGAAVALWSLPAARSVSAPRIARLKSGGQAPGRRPERFLSVAGGREREPSVRY